MAAPETTNEVTVRRLSEVVTGTWGKVKELAVSDVAWDSTNKKLTKTKNGTTSDVVTKNTLLSALGGSISDGNTGFVTGDAAYDALALKAPLASPTLTGTPKAPTATAGTNTEQIATTAFVKTAVDNAIATADALTYKGTVDGGSTGEYGALTPAASKGDVYKVSAAGKVDGVKVEVGDMLVCNTDSTAAATASNYSTIVANWDFIQTNIDGAVSSSASSVTANTVAIFDGTTGKIIKSSGYTIGKSVPSNAAFTDASVTAVGNHYTPTGGTSKSASGGAGTQLPTSDGSSNVQVVTGVTVDAAGHVTGVSSKGLWSPNTTYSSKAAVADGTDTSLCTTGEKYIWNNKQSALTTQTAYSAKGTATKVPQITTNTLGQVTGITEVDITGVTPASHTHGNITNAGGITATAVTVANGDSLVIVDSSDTNKKVAKSSISFDGSTTTTALTPKGTFESFAKSSDITTAINSLDATKTSTDGTNVQVKVTEADGKITAVNVTTDNTENKNNKVTSWTATTTDTHYPSEKLVKDTIDAQAEVVAAAINDLDSRISDIATTTSGAVLYDTAQSLSSSEMALARLNIGAGTSDLTIGTSSSTAAAGNHTHGYITNAGTITTSGALASGDALVFTDSSESNKLKKTSITFDGSTATQALTKKGTWETFNNYSHPTSSGNKHIPSGGSSGQFLGWSADGTAAWVANPNTDTKVTSSANHYTPATASGSDVSASASGATAAWSIDVVKGVTLNTDGKGHVTGISVTSGKIPANPNSDTKVKATASTSNSEFKILATSSASPTSGNATEAVYGASVTLNPSTNTITANISGTASAASSAASGSALETAINGKVSTSTTVNGHALSSNVTVTAADVSAVRYDTASQGLSSTQKSNARTNIGAGTSNLSIGTTSSTAAAGDHTHATSIATSTDTNQITLAASTKYAITAGGTSYVFTTPPNTTYSSKTAASGGTEVSLCTTGEKFTWNSKQDALTEMTDQEVTDLLAALT